MVMTIEHFNTHFSWNSNLHHSLELSSLYICKLHFSIKWFVHRDNDRSSLNCASMLKGGWWWKSCGRGLNGLYLNDPQDLTARQGMNDSWNVEHLASTQ
jgi:hypothetical protein